MTTKQRAEIESQDQFEEPMRPAVELARWMIQATISFPEISGKDLPIFECAKNVVDNLVRELAFAIIEQDEKEKENEEQELAARIKKAKKVRKIFLADFAARQRVQ